MKTGLLAAWVIGCSLAAGSACIHAAEDRAPGQHVSLSPDLLELLRAEMREISTGVQAVAAALATADWESIRETGEKIRASYLMEQQLTPAQAAELEHALPGQFRRLDADFHQRAERLGAAAAAHDPELAAFHYSRLIESCARCHALYARDRFPGFAPAATQDHRH